MRPVPEQHAAVGGGEVVAGELELRDDAEVAAAAPQGPEQVGLVLGVGADDGPVREDDLGTGDAVRLQAEQPGVPAHAATEGVAHDADVGRRAVQDGASVRRRGLDGVEPQGSAPYRHPAGRGVGARTGHRRRPQQDGVGEVAERTGVVPGALGSDPQPGRGGGAHDGRDLGGVAGDGDGGGPLRHGDVPRQAGRLVAAVGGEEDGPGQLVADGVRGGGNGGRGEDGREVDRGHGGLLFGWVAGGDGRV